MADVKRVYTFGNKAAEGNGKMRELLGGKGANLAEMNLIGIPVPPGFTITTEVCTEYYAHGVAAPRSGACGETHRAAHEHALR
jgi:pyruvate,orthophosphate dikinase